MLHKSPMFLMEGKDKQLLIMHHTVKINGGVRRRSSTFSWPWRYMESSGQLDARPIYPRKKSKLNRPISAPVENRSHRISNSSILRLSHMSNEVLFSQQEGKFTTTTTNNSNIGPKAHYYMK